MRNDPYLPKGVQLAHPAEPELPREDPTARSVKPGSTSHSSRSPSLRFLDAGPKKESMFLCLESNLALPMPPLVFFRPCRWSTLLTNSTTALKPCLGFGESTEAPAVFEGSHFVTGSTLTWTTPVLLQVAATWPCW